MFNVIEKEIQEQKEQLNMNFRINTLLEIEEKRATLCDALEELERIEIEFKYQQNLSWFDCVKYQQKIKSL